MNIHKTPVLTELLFNNRKLNGFTVEPDDFYWSCLNIFECDESEFSYADIKNSTPSDLPTDTFIYFPCSLASYTYCQSMSIGYSNQQIHFRFVICFHLDTWQENYNLRKFFDLLHDDIQQSRNFKVSDCFHDYEDYTLEVEFIGNTTQSVDNQVKLAMEEITTFHKHNVKNVI